MQFSLRLFCQLASLPHIVIGTLKLLALAVQLSQYSIGRLLSLVLRGDSVLERASLLFRQDCCPCCIVGLLVGVETVVQPATAGRMGHGEKTRKRKVAPAARVVGMWRRWEKRPGSRLSYTNDDVAFLIFLIFFVAFSLYFLGGRGCESQQQ